MKNILVIGNGEVGKAIVKVEQESGNKVYILDQKDTQLKRKIREYSNKDFVVCHICIPYSEDFVNICFNYLEKINADLIVINSTVKPGTTEELSDILTEYTYMVHSPIRGVHPHLYEGVKTFVKYVGGDEDSVEFACDHFNSLGIETQPVGSSKTSETLKILCTTQYGYNILLAKMIKELCDKEHIPFGYVYTDSNKTYNDGYTKLGMSNVVRPVLTAPTGILGGHCVGNNFELLPDSILKYFCKYINSNDSDSALKLIGLIENDYFDKVILENVSKKMSLNQNKTHW